MRSKVWNLFLFKEEETCCGFGGAFTVTYPEVSRSMMENKVKDIIASGADTVVTCEPGCLMNVAGGLHKAGSNIRAMHIIDLLASKEETCMSHEVPHLILDLKNTASMCLHSIPLAVQQATNRFVGGRAARVAELPQWEELRQIGSDIRLHTIENMDVYLTRLEAESACQRADMSIGQRQPKMRVRSCFRSPKKIMSKQSSSPSRWRPKRSI